MQQRRSIDAVDICSPIRGTACKEVAFFIEIYIIYFRGVVSEGTNGATRTRIPNYAASKLTRPLPIVGGCCAYLPSEVKLAAIDLARVSNKLPRQLSTFEVPYFGSSVKGASESQISMVVVLDFDDFSCVTS